MAIKVADAFVAVGADLSGFRKDLKTGAKDVQALAAEIKDALSRSNPVMFAGKSAAGNLIADLRSGIPLTRAFQTAASSLGGTLKGLSVNALHSSLNGVKNLLGGLKGAVGSVFQGLGIGAGIVGFQAIGRAIRDVIDFIPNLIEKGKAYGILVDEIGDATGATAQQSSKLAGTLLYLGAPVDGIISLLGQMSRNLEGAEKRLNALGIATKDANGATLNQVQILENARQAFSRFGDGTAKAKEIAIEFGRGGLKILVNYLKLTDEQAAIVTADLQKQGLILSESQRNLAETATRESARFQNALTGLGVTLFSTVGPQINAFFSNLTDFIVAHVSDIQAAVSQAISFILGLVGSLVNMGDSIDSFSASLQRGQAVTNPYSAGIADLTAQIGDLGDETDKTTDSTAGQRKAIQGQVTAIDGQISALKKLETQQDKTYTKALAAITKVLDAEGKLLDAEDAAASKADRDLQQTEALRDAKVALFEAQAQLRQDEIDNAKISDLAKRKSTDQDILAIAKAQQGVLDAQKAISDEAANRARDDRRTQLDATKEYIASVAKLLEDADNKEAALATLKKREAVLAAREAAQLAAGDTVGATDTHARIEALKTTETKAQQEIRNGLQETALEKQKAQLQEELSNITSTAKSATQIKKDELNKQLAALIAQEAAWALLTDKEKGLAYDVGQSFSGSIADLAGKTSLESAIKRATQAGKDLGTEIKTALGNLADAFSGVLGFLGDIKTTLDEIADSDVWKFLTEPIDLNKIPAGSLGDFLSGARGDRLPPGILPGTGPAGGSGSMKYPLKTPEYATGLWNSPARHLAWIDKHEMVVPPGLADAFRSLVPRMPALAGAGFSGQPVIIRLELGGKTVLDYFDRNLGFRSGR